MVRFKNMPTTTVVFFILIVSIITEVSGHGRLVEPPSRSSMWRFGFKTKPNYNDNELFCGGYTVQYQRNHGKCGVCGDAWHLPSPRPNEAGGAYGRGIIVRNYNPGQVIKSVVQITANHMGFFEFKLCPHNSPATVVKQECLDKFLLEMADGSGPRYYPGPGTGPFVVHLRLPDHLTCTQCVFQWTYTAGNNWGRCENGTSKVGCGPQETFRGCADVAIGDGPTSNDIPSSNNIPSYNGNVPSSNDIPYSNEIPQRKPSISAIPSRRPYSSTTRRPWSRPTRPSRRPYYQNKAPTVSASQPVVTRRPVSRRPVTRKPVSRRPITRRPVTTRRPPTSRPYSRPPRPTRYSYYEKPTARRPYYTTSRRPAYSRPTPYRPVYTPRPTPYRPVQYDKEQATKKSIRPTFKPKKQASVESEAGGSGGCRAVGVWASISGIASWCDSNCARGYCPSTHCDCS